MNNFLLRMLGRNDCDKDAVIPFPLKVTYFKVNNESDDGERWRHGKVLSLLSLFTCVRAAVNSAVLRSSEITFGLLIIFFILPYFFVVISNFNMPSFLQENEKSSERSELRFTRFQPVESCSCDQSQFLHQNAFWTPPNLLKLSSSCLLNNFKNHHLFQSSPYFQGQHMFAVPKFPKILLLFKSSVVQREDCVGNWQFLAAN